MKYLTIFSIGPVQIFIAQARKTRDLFAGSTLLSELIREVLDKHFAEAQVIFPYRGKGEESASKQSESYPNRFVAIVEKASPEEVQEFCQNVAKDLKELFYEKAKRALKEANLALPPDGSLFDSQVQDFPEVHYVALPLTDYAETYERAELLLGGVKNGRTFSSAPELGRKCSLCGERNVLFWQRPSEGPNLPFPYRRTPQGSPHCSLWEKAKNSLLVLGEKRAGLSLASNEGLCAICFTKRFLFRPKGQKDYRFPSSAEVALWGTLAALLKDSRDNWETILDLLEVRDFDAELLFPENLTEGYFQKYGLNRELLQDLKKKQSELKKAAKKLQLSWRSYYAILLLDGDSMGKWLSGSFLGGDLTKLQSLHEGISQKLWEYSQKVHRLFPAKILAECMEGKSNAYPGSLVYAGGDDVLLLCSLSHLWEVLKELRQEFPNFGEVVAQLTGRAVSESSTASLGVAIVHYKTPLSIALEAARKAEKKAKSLQGKDAFCLFCLKRSGEYKEAVSKWKTPTGTEELWVPDILEDLQESLQSSKDPLSSRWLFHLRRSFEYLTQESLPPELVETELKRLLGRTKGKKETKKDLLQKLSALYRSFTSLSYAKEGTFYPLENFLSLLEIVAFLSRSGD